MNKTTTIAISALATLGVACAQSLYYVGDEAQESIPLRWTVGVNAVYDNNVTPTILAGQPGHEEEAWSLNPYVGVSFTTVSPQTTIDLYARAGVQYFLTDSEIDGADDTNPNFRVGFDLTHRFNERLRFASRNSLAYEFEPEYSYGISTPRGLDPYLFWSTDNSVGYRWTERLGSYTGIVLTGFDADFARSDRDSWEIYHQMRYQLNQRTVLTGEYRYTEWSGDVNESQNHFITVGFDHRMSATSIASVKAGVQLRDVDGGDSTSSPFFEAAVTSQLNSRFTVNAFGRYSIEDFDTIQPIGSDLFLFSDQQVLRIGINGNYALTPRLSAFGGFDYINTSFDGGNRIGAPGTASGLDEDILNFFIGIRAQINDALSAECSINYTDNGSDFANRDFDRTRISAGLNYSF